MNKVDVLGIEIDSVNRTEFNEIIKSFLKGDQQRIVLYVNIHGVLLALKNNWMLEFYKQSDLVGCDGAGVIWGSKLLGNKIVERVSLTDLSWILLEIFRNDGNSLFVLGNNDDVLARAASRLKSRYPGLKINGMHNGYFDMEGEQNLEVVEKINLSGAEVLFVGMGMPMQEKWILDNRDKLNAKLIITCGGLLKFWSGDHKRCPLWVSKIGLEWFYKFLKEPVRLFSRYFPGNFTFFFKIIRSRIYR